MRQYQRSEYDCPRLHTFGKIPFPPKINGWYVERQAYESPIHSVEPLPIKDEFKLTQCHLTARAKRSEKICIITFISSYNSQHGMDTHITLFVFSFLSFQLELCNLLFSVQGIALNVQDVKAV